MFMDWPLFTAGLSHGYVLAFHVIEPKRLEEFVDSLDPVRPIPLDDLVRLSMNQKSTSGLCAITVDDGVGENVRALSRLFCARGWPATFYLPTQYLDSGEGMPFQWWQQIKSLLPREKIKLNSVEVDLSAPHASEAFFRDLERRWHTERMESYLPMMMELVDFVIRQKGITREALQPPAPIDWSEVAALSKHDLIRFESHGVTHAAMSSLSEEELAFEMKHSRDLVTEHTGRACSHLAYPFGSAQSIGGRTARLARRYYDSAVTMTLGHVDFANPWLLPRIPLYPENSRRMARLKVFLKCNALIRQKSVA
jgi:peptidoglycan/xylan/chitin deacetylase (PgdA/CDA1 family)